MRNTHTAIPLSLILILLYLLTLPVSAFAASPGCADSGCGGTGSTAPDKAAISSPEDLVQWHNSLPGWGEWPELAEDIIINRPITLSETTGRRDLGAIEHVIRVTAGGKLTLANSKIAIQGPDTVIIVEPGGRLLLQSGAIYTAPDSFAVVVEQGGKVVKSAAFLLDGGGILDKNQSNELPAPPNQVLPPVQTPPPDPEPQPPADAPRPITNIMGFDCSLSCKVGERPAQSDYPSTVKVTYLATETSYEQMELPVQWNLDPVNFEAAGTYTVEGTFSTEALAAHRLSNPDGITATLKLLVQEAGAIKALTGKVLSVNENGYCHIQLTLPALPTDAVALYVYRSADGQHWLDRQTADSDFLPYVQTVLPNTYVNYRYQTDYRPIYLRVEVVGSDVAGISNEIKLEIPMTMKPGEGTDTGGTDDDGSSGGNRGGGGQSEGDRELPGPGQPAGGASPPPTDKKPPGENLAGIMIPESSSILEEDNSPSVGFTYSSAPTEAGTPQSEVQDSGTSISPAASDGKAGSAPLISTSSNAGQAEPGENAVSSPAPAGSQKAGLKAVEADANGIGQVQELAGEVQNSPPLSKSRGVLLTAGATGFAACGLILLRKLYQKRKRKP